MAALGELAMVANKATSETQAAKRKILLVDDHRAFRDGLREFLNDDPSLCVCGEAQDAKQALTEVEASHPDMVITDISLHEETTLRLIREQAARPVSNLPADLPNLGLVPKIAANFHFGKLSHWLVWGALRLERRNRP